ncbi:TRCF domain-containing protein [Parvularcula dongshanensis]|uniref:Transcription-repair coupling factor (Superfamily II helicase) n=1 Tax=Parvularcula dongshanensis TaxID=1173995 RepID=A0A840I390_9PROT|nr:TRCF domain-containing protein [Parvularcula dongshanensis]MBB4658762.1 transcription-repair coupling factor (superfamily II helicase) [Parvularcula dongshanensis]
MAEALPTTLPVLSSAAHAGFILADLVSRPGAAIVVANGMARLAALSEALRTIAPDRTIVTLPPWDVLAQERRAPSPESAGLRAAALALLAEGGDPVVFVTPESLLQRVPPLEPLAALCLYLKRGERGSADRLGADLIARGYRAAPRADTPCTVAVSGQVVDVVRADGTGLRVTFGGDTIETILAFDIETQRSEGRPLRAVTLSPASELLTEALLDEPDREARLTTLLPGMTSIPELWPSAVLVLDHGASDRIEVLTGAYDALREDAARFQTLYVGSEDWQAVSAAHSAVSFTAPNPSEVRPAPSLATTRAPRRALKRFFAECQESGLTVVLAGESDRRLERIQEAVAADGDVQEARLGSICGSKHEGTYAVRGRLDAGFADPALGVALVTDRDLLGAGDHAEHAEGAYESLLFGDQALSIGDAVVHLDHGLARLDGLETVVLGEEEAEVVRLTFADDERLLVPVHEADRLWRYGGRADDVRLDDLGAEDWAERRAETVREILASAEEVAKMIDRRDAEDAPEIKRPGAVFRRFCAGFPHPVTGDQACAVDAVVKDLASGKPMDRVLIGDVGYGKTEVALRAAAAVALRGGQVAFCVPTTILATQTLAALQARFEGFGVEVAALTGATSDTDGRTVREGLASGEIGIVVGTQALLSEDISFSNLSLVIIDEEQLFGAADKEALRQRTRGCHRLSMTATPIPRTLAAAGAGLRTVSVLADPPPGRWPVRTRIAPLSDDAIVSAITREARLGGRSFVVCPRINGIDPLAKMLEDRAPDLRLRIAHGDLPADEAARAVDDFANGDADVLLATSLVGNGVDVARANTMIVAGAELFGLAQLHQLRGRVGRGGGRAVFWLLHEDDLSDAQEARLGALAAEDRLGAGFALSASDLDQRGAGDLFGDEQAGHLHVLGVGLYRHLLTAALAGREATGALSTRLEVGPGGRLPEAYIPDETARLRLYARLAHANDVSAVDALSEETEDRFGPLPEAARLFLDVARLRAACRTAGIAALDAGPKAVAITLSDERQDGARLLGSVGRTEENDGRLLLREESEAGRPRVALALKAVEALTS